MKGENNGCKREGEMRETRERKEKGCHRKMEGGIERKGWKYMRG